ncbi:hypothetical protein CYLTODRAFT_247998 [Cylindrobasidium torrendii FP15055 ss-10]|uniref:Uncharacterized protein n=1 Tax=Cylindrobasidium torrendii FP15055 ss-10 TaxID=1314674 RepID=A0A0D7BED4_9AGAR|nr:hypothetical protein CYLTODRAFT_247998 [Cylindrobasidium torrendii FP15055 ss-10]
MHASKVISSPKPTINLVIILTTNTIPCILLIEAIANKVKRTNKTINEGLKKMEKRTSVVPRTYIKKKRASKRDRWPG